MLLGYTLLCVLKQDVKPAPVVVVAAAEKKAPEPVKQPTVSSKVENEVQVRDFA